MANITERSGYSYVSRLQTHFKERGPTDTKSTISEHIRTASNYIGVVV
jgi:hypothetical protein